MTEKLQYCGLRDECSVVKALEAEKEKNWKAYTEADKDRFRLQDEVKALKESNGKLLAYIRELNSRLSERELKVDGLQRTGLEFQSRLAKAQELLKDSYSCYPKGCPTCKGEGYHADYYKVCDGYNIQKALEGDVSTSISKRR